MSYNAFEVQNMGYLSSTCTNPIALIGTHGYFCFQSAPVSIITDYCTRLKNRLIQQYKNSPLFQELLCALNDEFQTLEYVFSDLISKRGINSAVATQLDDLGDIVGEKRNGRGDDAYRLGIRLRIILNSSNGEWETLINAVYQLTEATFVKISGDYPRGLVIFTNGTNIPTNLVTLIEEISMAGIRITVSTNYGVGFPFGFQPDGGSNDNLGFMTDATPGSGGVISEKLT